MVESPRREFLQVTAAAAGAFALAPRLAGAQAHPAKPLRWIVGYPPGGGAGGSEDGMTGWRGRA
jgi:hypothetical protein